MWENFTQLWGKLHEIDIFLGRSIRKHKTWQRSFLIKLILRRIYVASKLHDDDYGCYNEKMVRLQNYYVKSRKQLFGRLLSPYNFR